MSMLLNDGHISTRRAGSSDATWVYPGVAESGSSEMIMKGVFEGLYSRRVQYSGLPVLVYSAHVSR